MKTDQERTTKELVAAMSSLVSFLQFEGEESGMFPNDRLPTLDAELWVCEETNLVKYSFFEKETCLNRVLHKNTALSENSIRASLTQEVVRRLKNCSLELPLEEKQGILSKLGQKMVNSGHSVRSTQYMLVHGVVKFMEMVRCSNLPNNHPDYRPVHCDKEFNVFNRKLKKILAKTSWFEDSQLNKKLNWRKSLPSGWGGGKPDQYKVPEMKFSTILKVPSSKDGRLLKSLAAAEPRIARSSGYQVKLVEKSGKPLSNMFPKSISKSQCHKAWCAVCTDSTSRGAKLCSLKSVVYLGVCQLCEAKYNNDKSKKHLGLYVGQTYRTLSERAKEHRVSYRDLESKSFMFKHWAIEHPDELEPPRFEFSVVRHHKSPLERMIHEAVLISEKATLNSKSERKGYKIARLTVEKSPWEQLKNIELDDAFDSKLLPFNV